MRTTNLESARERKLMKQLLVAAVVISACIVVHAKEITWTGAVDTDFANESNWSGGAPTAGDTVKFGKTSTIDGSFDFGSQGLTIDVANGATLTCHTGFGGSGRLTKTGTGIIKFEIVGSTKNVGSFTGGFRMESGQLTCSRPSSAKEYSLYIGDKANEVELVLSGDELSDPWLRLSGYEGVLSNPIRVTGTSAPGCKTFSAGDKGTIAGDIKSATDILFDASSGSRKFLVTGNVDVQGNTFTFNCGKESDVGVIGSSDWWTKRTFVGGLSLCGARAEIRAQGTDSDGELTIACPTDLYRSWASTNVIVSGDETILTLKDLLADGLVKDSGSLSRDAFVRLLDGAKLRIDTGAEQRLRGLSVDGKPVPNGKYTSENLPEALEGDGAVWIGAFKNWIGGSSGAISSGENWEDGTPAKTGDILVFEKDVTLTSEDFDFGASGMGIAVIGSGVTVTCRSQFSGSGKLTKYGIGTLMFDQKTNGSFTGGMRVVSGKLKIKKPSDAWSIYVGDKTCVVEMVMSGNDETDPQITFSGYEAGLNNSIHVLGTNAEGHATVAPSDKSSINGNIVSETDFGLGSGDLNRPYTVGGNVDVGEHVFYISCKCSKVTFGDSSKTFVGNLTASQTGGAVLFNSKGTDVDGTLTALAPIELYNSWAGTNVVIRGEGAKLSLQPKATLVRESVVTIDDGGKLDIAAGVSVKISQLIVDGRPMQAGTYTAANLPEVISGEGRVRVGQLGFALFVQ